MARINKITITLCALFFTSLTLSPLTHASENARPSAIQKAHNAKTKKQSSQIKTTSKQKSSGKTSTKRVASSSSKKVKTSASGKTLARRGKISSSDLTLKGKKAQTLAYTEQCTKRKGHKKRCVKVKSDQPTTIAAAHKLRVQKAQKTALTKLMGQIGKPYRWGGTSPRTGFDCSGLIYYAYKDLVKFRIPRTANEMYHLRDAAPVDRGELESGDLVFFRTQGRGTADHVGVYVGNGKFIQSPRSGRDIQITSLSEDYWQRHYVGARRVMTPRTIR
ncbi:C40 family peptidase [Franconibacter pulveris 1160]|uniref:C40 family peptidase n=1 Tax=Franconibacter pulveris TaxID=435910 RepID=UPI0004672144|nr:C40 family peptidase [Franconibacter pulveris]